MAIDYVHRMEANHLSSRIERLPEEEREEIGRLVTQKEEAAKNPNNAVGPADG